MVPVSMWMGVWRPRWSYVGQIAILYTRWQVITNLYTLHVEMVTLENTVYRICLDEWCNVSYFCIRVSSKINMLLRKTTQNH